jgi:hypothetical protein
MGVEECLISQVISSSLPPSLLPVTPGWRGVPLWEKNNLRLQVTKPILFSTAYEGIQNCKLYRNYSAGQVIN